MNATFTAGLPLKMNFSAHDHNDLPNRFAVIPTPERLNGHEQYTGKGVTIAFLDSGFIPHPDLTEPDNRIIAYHDLAGEQRSIYWKHRPELWHWHGTQTSVSAAGNGRMSQGVYRGLASQAQVVLIKASKRGRISEENITSGIEWAIENRERYGIRVLNISLGGDNDVPSAQSEVNQAAEEAVRQGIVVVAAAGNSGAEGKRSIPPATAPSAITVGGYNDNNELDNETPDLYHSNFGITADGIMKPELIAPAMFVAAPILPGTDSFLRAEILSRLAAAPDYQLPKLWRETEMTAKLFSAMTRLEPQALRSFVDNELNRQKIVAPHYQHVDGTSFAAPIVTSIVAQMLEANPTLTPVSIKNVLISTADRIADAAVVRQGYGCVDAWQAVALAASLKGQLESVGFGPPRIENGKVVFVFHYDDATSVSVAGDFNNWSLHQVKLGQDDRGLWQGEMSVPPPGRYNYKFVVNDGQRWLEDPSNCVKQQDNFGGVNSVLIVA